MDWFADEAFEADMVQGYLSILIKVYRILLVDYTGVALIPSSIQIHFFIQWVECWSAQLLGLLLWAPVFHGFQE